ncbi:MAG: GyrI-like domain-containing protein [Acidobacteriota bacterium]
MLDRPTIIQTTARTTAVIRLKVPRSEIQRVMGPAIQEVIAAVVEQGAGPAGPVYSHHFDVTPETFDFEVGVPVHKAIAPVGRVISSDIPVVHAARTIYRGSYEGLGAAWGEFDAWIRANGHTTAPGIFETYLKGPESGQDSPLWETELIHPIAN